MVNDEASRIVLGIPAATKSGTVGMKNWTGLRIPATAMPTPINCMIRVGSSRHSRSNFGPTQIRTTTANTPPAVPLTPLSKASRPKSSSRNKFSSTGAVNRPNPRALKATTTMRTVRICMSRENAASVETGRGSSSVNDSPRTSVFSHRPLSGSLRKNEEMAATTTGTPSR